ncbi:U2 small nuclear ribonucleoprotein B [Backusella circina FSU 941]|nr:U2 small nuclear ribonucleoprotein B [Backusella circina FSU 941]
MVGGAPPQFAGVPPSGFPNAPPVGFPAPSPFASAAPPPSQPTVVNGIPVAKQPLNTTPSRTVYVSNLNEKVKVDVLKNSLRTLFKQFGDVLDVVAHQNIRMRGQAFVAFLDEESAEKAIKELQHFTLYDKPMVLQFARNKSDVHAKKDGDYDTHYKQRMHKKEEVSKMPLPGSHKPTFKASRPQGQNRHFNPTANIPDEYLPPNNILFLQKLPETITQQDLVELFQRFPGFREVRMIPTKKSIAFVEYDNELQSATARSELSGHVFDPEHTMKVTFARK